MTEASGQGLGALVPTSDRSLPLTFERQGNRWLASFDRALLGRDVLLKAQVVAIAHQPIGATSPPALLPQLGERLVSGALRLQRAGDSLIISEYMGTFQGEPRYRRRAALPILRVPTERRVIVDAAPVWMMLAFRRPEVMSALGWAGNPFLAPFPDRASLTGAPVTKAPTPPRDAALVSRPLGNNVVTYAVSIVRLPKEPMRPRLSDPRIPFVTVESDEGTYIYRFRLEKRDTAAAVSEVVQPILVQFQPSVLPKWEPFLRKAVDAWNTAFDSIGFHNVLKVIGPDDADTLAAADRPSIIVEVSDDNGGATNPNVDPRSGEVLQADVRIGAPADNAYAAMYFSMFGDQYPWSRLPIPDSLQGAWLQLVLTHEIGHALGMNHNFKVDAYPTDSLRQPDFVRRMGFVATIMGYSPLNSVVQLEDRMPSSLLLGGIGPYDRWALRWAYRPIPEAATPEAELPVLEQWRAKQDTFAYLRASIGEGMDSSPYSMMLMLGDDVLKSASYMIRNLTRVGTAMKAELTSRERAVLRGFMGLALRFVELAIGGSTPQAPFPRDLSQMTMQPIDSAYQVRALQFVLAHLYYGQDELVASMLAKPLQGDSTLVLPEMFLPEWKASEDSALLAEVGQWQENMASGMVDMQTTTIASIAGRFQRLQEQGQHGLLTVLCREMATLDRRLQARTADSLSPGMRQQVKAMADSVATMFDRNNAGVCTN